MLVTDTLAAIVDANSPAGRADSVRRSVVTKLGGSRTHVRCRPGIAKSVANWFTGSSQRSRCAKVKYCELHRNNNPAKQERWRRRRAFKIGTAVEKFSDIEIFERDGWKCGICGKRVDKRLKYPHRRSASLDHIEPLSLGGAHVRANVQLAHLDCNVRKGAHEPAQLRLVG